MIKPAAILFVDIMNSAEVSNYFSLEEYYTRIVRPFQEICGASIDSERGKLEGGVRGGADLDVMIRGDECALIATFADGEALRRRLWSFFRIITQIKLRWYLTDYNRTRVREGQLPVELGIGLHNGQVYVDKRPEGYAINFAKRIEGEARNGHYTNVNVSRPVHQMCREIGAPADFAERTVDLRGISHPVVLYELKHFEFDESTDFEADWFGASGDIVGGNAELFREIIQNNPYNLWITLLYVYSYLGRWLGQPQLADSDVAMAQDLVKLLTESIRIEADCYSTYFALAVLSKKLGEMEMAERNYRRAVELNPGSSVLAYNLATFYLERREESQALAAFERYLDLAQGVGREAPWVAKAQAAVAQLGAGNAAPDC